MRRDINLRATRTTSLIAGCLVLGVLAPVRAHAQTLFSDNFEAGLGKWTTVGSGYITTDPMDSSNHVLAFSALSSGGDTFSESLTFKANTPYVLSCDYLGLGPAAGGVGGYLGIAPVWLMGDSTYPAYVQMVDDGQWHHYSYQWTPGASTEQIFAEQWLFDPGAVPGNVFFDNITAAALPEPGSMAVLGVGALVFIRRCRRA